MGTNYYHEREGYEGAKCTRCGGFCSNCAEEARVHIGKSSVGWTFGFHATETSRSYADWLRALEAGGRIVNEYGEVVSLDYFKELVANKRKTFSDGSPPYHHASMYPDGHSFTDPDGHSFSTGDFS